MTQLQLLCTGVTDSATATRTARAWTGIHHIWRNHFIITDRSSLPFPFTHATEYFMASIHRVGTDASRVTINMVII